MRTPFMASAAILASLLVPPAGALAATTPSRGAAAKAAKPAPAVASVLPWIEDDLPRAMGEATARKLPIFVESWAPW